MFTLRSRGRTLSFARPAIMGILNCTPDSFYPVSRTSGVDSLLHRAEEMLRHGADILDIGGQSTRPGSERIPVETELARVIAPVAAVRSKFPEAVISIDTYYARVAQEAVGAGADLVNDISAGTMDPDLIDTVAGLSVPYVLMHMQGQPGSMQQAPTYGNVTEEVLAFMLENLVRLRSKGIRDIIVDPGIGFGKTADHNFELVRNLGQFRTTGCPVLLGVSRKSFISRTLGVPPSDALTGTLVLQTIGLMEGASLLRVHDVREAVQQVILWEQCLGRS